MFEGHGRLAQRARERERESELGQSRLAYVRILERSHTNRQVANMPSRKVPLSFCLVDPMFDSSLGFPGNLSHTGPGISPTFEHDTVEIAKMLRLTIDK